MPRVYKADLRGKRYIRREKEEFIPAIDAIKNGRLSIRQAAKKYGIAYTVLRRHYKNKNIKSQGGQTSLTYEEEALLVDRISTCADWGFPFDRTSLRLFIKSYLDTRGKVIKKFKNNNPGQDFVRSFLERHKERLTERLCQNIKRVRAAISPEIVSDSFSNLKKEIENVEPGNIINYDETNLADDPGRKKVISKRGCKYPERVMNSSKTATSLMFACAGDSKLLPPYIVYKSLHLYRTWMECGPSKARYNRSKSGWFDALCFEDWLEKVIVPFYKNLE